MSKALEDKVLLFNGNSGRVSTQSSTPQHQQVVSPTTQQHNNMARTTLLMASSHLLILVIFAGPVTVSVPTSGECDVQGVYSNISTLWRDDLGMYGGFPTTKDEMDRVCRGVPEMANETVLFLQPCFGSKTILDFVADLLMEAGYKFRGTGCFFLSDDIAKESFCLNQNMDAFEECTKDLSLDFWRLVTQFSLGNMCCPIKEFFSCITDVASESCGRETEETFRRFFGYVFPETVAYTDLCDPINCGGGSTSSGGTTEYTTTTPSPPPPSTWFPPYRTTTDYYPWSTEWPTEWPTTDNPPPPHHGKVIDVDVDLEEHIHIHEVEQDE